MRSHVDIPFALLSLPALFLILCSLLLGSLLFSILNLLLPVVIFLDALLLCPLLLLLLRGLSLSILFLSILRALLLLLCGLLLSISFLLLRFSLPVPALVLLLISILFGALVSALVSLLVLFWLLRRGLSIALPLRFVSILLIWLLCVSHSAGAENEQQNRCAAKFNRFHKIDFSVVPGRLVGGECPKSGALQRSGI